MASHCSQRKTAVDLPYLDSFVKKPRCYHSPIRADGNRSNIVAGANVVLLVEEIIKTPKFLLDLRESPHELHTGPVGGRGCESLLDALKHCRQRLAFLRS